MQHLILLHGALGHPPHFDDIVPLLKNHFRCHTFSFIGHAEEPLPNAGFRMEDLLQQLTKWIQKQQLSSFHILGYSMGGYVALLYAAQYPEKVKSIMTIATKMDWSPEIVAHQIKSLQPEIIATKAPKFAAALEIMHGPKWKDLMKAVAQMMMHLGIRPPLTDEVLKTITCKTMLLVGDGDTMVTNEETFSAVKKLPFAEAAILNNSGHPIEQVDRLELKNYVEKFWQLPH